MSKILVEYENYCPTVYLLCRNFDLYEKRGACTFRILESIKVKSVDIAWCDVVISIRGYSCISANIARIAKKYERKYILFMDDDLLNPPLGYRVVKGRISSLKKILKYTDLFLCSNPLMGEEYQKFTKTGRYEIIHEIIYPSDVVTQNYDGNDNNKKVKILYAANKGHVSLFDKYIRPIMPYICTKYGDDISMTFIGVQPDLSEYEEIININYIPSMAFEKYREYMRNNQFDIGIAPLNNDSFSNKKYFNKFIEYSLFGITGIFSNCPPYTFVVKNKVNGFLADNTDSSWRACLEAAIEKNELRRQCAKNAQEFILDTFSQDKWKESIDQNIPEFKEYSAPYIQHIRPIFIEKIEYALFKLMEYLYFTLIHLKEDGLSGTIKKILIHIRDARAFGKYLR